MPILDGLRGIAILMATLTHVGVGWRRAATVVQNANWIDPLEISSRLRTICARAGNGVQLFFVVSAFTLTIRTSQGGSIGDYALRRIARVGPECWLAGLAYTLAEGSGPRLLAPYGTKPTDIAVAAAFSSVWQGGAALAVVPGGWSVCCEVAFHVALPVTVFTVDDRISRVVLLTGAAVVAAQLWERSGMIVGIFSLIEQALVFMFGVTAALLAKQIRIPHCPGAVPTVLACAITLLPFSPVHYWYLMPQVPFGLIAAVVVALSAAYPLWILAPSTLCHAGQVSYSTYLLHFASLRASLHAAKWLVPHDDWRTLALHFGLTIITSFAVACLTVPLG